MKNTKTTRKPAELVYVKPKSLKIYQGHVVKELIKQFGSRKQDAAMVASAQPMLIANCYAEALAPAYVATTIFTIRKVSTSDHILRSAKKIILRYNQKTGKLQPKNNLDTVKKQQKNTIKTGKVSRKSIRPAKKTVHLSDNDLKHILPVMAKILRTAQGPGKAINNYWIQRYIRSQIGVDLNRRQVQFILREIRVKGHVECVIGDSNGYYIATSPGLAKAYQNRLESLIKELGELLQAFTKQSNAKFKKWGSVTVKAPGGKMPKNIIKITTALKKQKKTFNITLTGNSVRVESPAKDVLDRIRQAKTTTTVK